MKKILIGLGILALFLIIEPIAVFWMSYFFGWIASFVIGDSLCYALNTTFNAAFTKDMIPLIAGAIGWIASYFAIFIGIHNKKD